MYFLKDQWITLQDCLDHKECKKTYPDHPYCDSEGKCIKPPDNMKPPKTFNKQDVCKKFFGDTFVYDPEAECCKIPICSMKVDKCPRPSKCWRGMKVY